LTDQCRNLKLSASKNFHALMEGSMIRRLGWLLAALALTAATTVAGVTLTAGAAQADGCYTWGRTLSQGASGADGIAGPQTFNRLYALQDDDCTPANFSYAELNNCNSTWAGGAVAASTARFNALVSMWKLQAMRHALGDVNIAISSSFRSYACNSAVGGASNSRHLYGDAVDLVGSPSFCRLAQQARYHGFGQILGPGYPDHNDHTHVAAVGGWSAPTCGI
jgi:zinc D-Ala-D-Ala carboxypeptidase